MEAIQANPASADAWCRFLDKEDAASGASAAAFDAAVRSKSSAPSTSGVAVSHLYQRATELVPRVKGEATLSYMKIWIGYARHLWYVGATIVTLGAETGHIYMGDSGMHRLKPGCRLKSEDEGRDLFKALKNQHIGDTCAHLYGAWAQLERASGNDGKAVSVLQKGLKEGAEPRRYVAAQSPPACCPR